MYHIVLDQTSFYPEGGGQPSDTGYIEDLYISHVYEEDHIIYHVTNAKPEKLQHLKCSIDWDRRFDNMQQHLGQHILSACIDKLINAETVGFHLGVDYVTIDVTMESISQIQVDKVEYFANQIVFNNLSVTQLYPNESVLKKIPLRKPPKVKENIRIIEINQFDFSPCGGTHPTHTGEVGLIKIRKLEKIRDTTRVEFACGNRALKDYNWKNNSINQISSLLSLKDVDSLKGVEKIYTENISLKKEIRKLKEENLNYEAGELYRQTPEKRGIKIITKVFENRDFGEVRLLAAKTVSNPGTMALLGVKNEKAQIILSCSDEVTINMNELFKEISPMINGKGGGNSKTAQGGGDDKGNLEGALQAAHTIVEKRYLKLL